MLYNEEYLQEYEQRANSDIGRAIYKSRWRLVEKYCHRGTLLDYGCGSGAFHKSSENGFDAYGYDINPYSGFDIVPPDKVDILTMWDVIEHLPNPTGPLTKLSPEYVFICTPNIDNADEVTSWKHFKPGEHIHYFNLKSLTAILACAGYEVVEHNFEEGSLRDPNNEDAILTVVARKCNYPMS